MCAEGPRRLGEWIGLAYLPYVISFGEKVGRSIAIMASDYLASESDPCEKTIPILTNHFFTLYPHY